MDQSHRLFERARKVIPSGTQTNAKRPDERFAGAMPFYIERADGCRIQDVDGRWYVDFRSALGPIILGYRHPHVDDAVRTQMERGVLFSMASPLEIDVAEQLTHLVPGLEQVRFLKTGNEANNACVRLARAFTGRDHLITCGYHGHGDWFSCGGGRSEPWCRREGNGVPAVLDDLVTRIPYGDVAEAERVFAETGDRLAGAIMVPYDWGEHVSREFVERMRSLTQQHGAILIFDQVLTGFRLAPGGAQEYFGVTPDLTTYAKAIANGYPLAAFGGRREVMAKLDDVIITSTYAGETLSLAAARATMEILTREPVLAHIWKMGERLRRGFEDAATEAALGARCFGLPPALQFAFRAADARRGPGTDSDGSENEGAGGDQGRGAQGSPGADDAAAQRTFFRELYRRGIFAGVPFLLNYAHRESDIDETIEAMREALDVVREDHPELGPKNTSSPG